MKSTIDFALINAKELEVVGISNEKPENRHNALIMAKAEVNYLACIAILQKNIKEWYEPQLIKNIPVEEEPEYKGVSTKWKKVEELLKDHKLKKEIDNLWYDE